MVFVNAILDFKAAGGKPHYGEYHLLMKLKIRGFQVDVGVVEQIAQRIKTAKNPQAIRSGFRGESKGSNVTTFSQPL